MCVFHQLGDPLPELCMFYKLAVYFQNESFLAPLVSFQLFRSVITAFLF